MDTSFQSLAEALDGYITLLALERTPRRSAPPLTDEEATAWRWLRRDANLTRQQQRQAESALQPTFIDFRQAPDGRMRRLPAVVQAEGRERNDFDHLMDLRQGSPNGRIRGFWDWERGEIERENAFTPDGSEDEDEEEEDERERGLESGLGVTGGDSRFPFCAAFEDPSPVEPRRRRARRLNERLSREELREIARRLLGLSGEMRMYTTQLVNGLGMRWNDALEYVEERAWWYNLGPEQQRVFRRTHMLYRFVLNTIDEERLRGEELKQAIIKVLTYENTFVDNEIMDHLMPFLQRRDESPPNDRVRGGRDSVYSFWHVAVGHFDRIPESRRLFRPARALAILRIMAYKREMKMRRLLEHLDLWLEVVGDRRREMEGIEQRGDFWYRPQQWWELFWDWDETYCKVSYQQALVMSQGELAGMITDGQVSPQTEQSDGPSSPQTEQSGADTEDGTSEE